MKQKQLHFILFLGAFALITGVQPAFGGNMRPDQPVDGQWFESSKFGIKTIKPSKDNTWTFTRGRALKALEKGVDPVAAQLKRWGDDQSPDSGTPQVVITWRTMLNSSRISPSNPDMEQFKASNHNKLLKEFKHRVKKDFDKVESVDPYKTRMPFSDNVKGFKMKGIRKEGNQKKDYYVNVFAFNFLQQTWVGIVQANDGFHKKSTFGKDMKYVLTHTEISVGDAARGSASGGGGGGG